jgi:hypothetical protein
VLVVSQEELEPPKETPSTGGEHVDHIHLAGKGASSRPRRIPGSFTNLEPVLIKLGRCVIEPEALARTLRQLEQLDRARLDARAPVAKNIGQAREDGEHCDVERGGSLLHARYAIKMILRGWR